MCGRVGGRGRGGEVGVGGVLGKNGSNVKGRKGCQAGSGQVSQKGSNTVLTMWSTRGISSQPL